MRSRTSTDGLSRVGLAGILALAALLVADGLSAQTLRGRVAEGGSQDAMPDVIVSLLDEDANVLAQTETGPNGGFSLQAPGPGEYYVRAERLSYTTVTDGIFAFASEAGEMSIVLFMLPQPTELEGIDVRIEREQVRRRLRSAGFYERAAMGFGRHIGPDEIDRRPIFTFSDFLRGIPGVRFQDEAIQFSGGLTGTCSPNIYMDGAQVFQDYGLTTLIQPEEVEGIEVYRGVAQTPMEWGGFNGSCGVILIWTKSGRRE
jgi:hypothetical protein